MSNRIRTTEPPRLQHRFRLMSLVLGLVSLAFAPPESRAFEVMETTIAEVHAAYKSGELTSRQLVQMYLDRIAAYDKRGPAINAVITLNPQALQDADKLDAAYKKTGPVGALHGIPVIIKDQIDVAGIPTTLGSVLFKDYVPARDSFVAAKLKQAGAIVLAKVTLGELGGGDTYGSLFGATRNPYALDRTVGGSSGGTGGGLAANFATIGIGEEGSSSIRRPSAWNSLVGMRPTSGLVSGGGSWDGWPAFFGSVGPMARTVEDLARVLDVIVGYDPEDPRTAYGVGQAPPGSYTQFLDKNGLKGARIGVIREPMSGNADPASEDFKNVDAVFGKAVEELRAAGAAIVDNVVIPDIVALIDRRVNGPGDDTSLEEYLGRNASSPFKTRAELYTPENVAKLGPPRREGGRAEPSPAERRERHYRFLLAREELRTNLLKVMADHRLDAIVHKSVEHPPNRIEDALTPPYARTRGVLRINTTLAFVSSMSVPAGFSKEGLPVGITFLGRAYAEPVLLKLAYAYEQSTLHRKPPAATPALARAAKRLEP